MRDFTLDIYRELLESFQCKGYKLITYRDYLLNAKAKVNAKYVILRHDIDERPENALSFAHIEESVGAKATYYFRAKGENDIIRTVVRLGHEVGYHYEDLSLCKGDTAKAYAHFETYLNYFRQFYPVETVCMHGSPVSKYDNRDLWKTYDYRDLGIIGEPYIDTDFSDVLYLTDTGRCWDGYKVSVRDKIPLMQDEWNRKGWTWHTTHELIAAVEQGQTPPHILLTTHPQRWTNNKAQWWHEYIAQTIKNCIKKLWVKH